MKTIRNILAAMALGSALSVDAIEPAPIVVSIESDSVSTVTVPEALMERLRPHEGEPESSGETAKPRNGMAGWRVQVFSDNNPRTAKNEARAKEQTVAAKFPQYRTYKRYQAPYWRLHVGDFRTQAEAQNAAAEMRRAFPAFSREIRIVKARINVVE